jgi:hypothetical protein
MYRILNKALSYDTNRTPCRTFALQVCTRTPHCFDQQGSRLRCRDLRLVPQLPSHEEWNTGAGRSRYASVELDAYHTKLLNRKTVDDLFHGLVSVIFWGYVSGTDGRFRVNRAISKARILKNGRGRLAAQKPTEILKCLRQSRRRLFVGDIEGALLTAMSIKFLGMSFASKILMFIIHPQPWYTTRLLGDV